MLRCYVQDTILCFDIELIGWGEIAIPVSVHALVRPSVSQPENYELNSSLTGKHLFFKITQKHFVTNHTYDMLCYIKNCSFKQVCAEKCRLTVKFVAYIRPFEH